MMELAAMLTLVMPEPQNRSSVTRAGAHVIAGVERRHPAEIAALLAALRTGAPDDVVDVSGIDAGAIGQRAQYRGAELLRMDARQGALAGLADAPRRPACIDDQRVNHGAFLA